MPSPWVQRAVANNLPAKALDRTPTKSDREDIPAPFSRRITIGDIQRASAEFERLRNYDHYDADGSPKDCSVECPCT